MWEEQISRPSGETVRHWPRVVAPVAIALAFGALGHWRLALGVLLLAAAVAVVTARSPAARLVVARLFASISHGVGVALTFVLLGITELLVMVPAAALQRLLPRRGPWADDAGSWQPRPAADGLERRGFGVEPSALVSAGPVRRTARALVLATGVVAIGVLLDFAAGAAIDHLRGVEEPAPATITAGTDPAAHPAMAGSTWAAGYYDDLGRLRFDYVPFLYPGLADTTTPFINVRDGVRRSHQPDADGELPEVWLFGGSTLWGEGQRDDHTIPSELSRLAEEDGLALRVVNRGSPGYGSWQEALLFERALAEGRRPELAVFYDGANDTRMQAEQATIDPTHFEYPAIHELITDQPIGVAAAPPVIDDDPDQGGAFAPVWDRYVEASLIAKALRQVESVAAGDHADAYTATGRDDVGGSPTTVVVDTTDSVLAMYQRGRSLSRALGERDGVLTRHFWQPVESATPAYRQVGDSVAPTTIDLSGVLDDTDEPVWLDGVHTNELGARLTAAELWQHLRPDIAAWYERERGDA